jgi:hypothetical protein
MTKTSVKRLFGAVVLFLLVMPAGNHLNRSLASSGSVYAAQDAPAQPSALKVGGAIPIPLTLTSEDLAKMPRTTATLASDGGTDTYEGVLLYDILVKAGWQFGHMPAGKGVSMCILATGKDGFQAVFSMGEIDPQLAGEKVIVADKLNGQPLPDRYKPFRIISPQDKKHARSIYSLVTVDVIRLPQ